MKFTIPGPKTLALSAALATLLTTGSQAAVMASFSGGDGSPLTFTLPAPVSFTLLESNSLSTLVFVFHDVFTANGFNASEGTGTIAISINGGEAELIETYFAISGNGLEDINVTDFQFSVSTAVAVPLAENDVITLSAGTFTTDNAFSLVPSTNTSFEAVATGVFGRTLTTNAVPEPSVMGLLGLGAAGFFLRRRRAA